MSTVTRLHTTTNFMRLLVRGAGLGSFLKVEDTMTEYEDD